MTRIRPARPDGACDVLDLHVASIRALGPAAYDEQVALRVVAMEKALAT